MREQEKRISRWATQWHLHAVLLRLPGEQALSNYDVFIKHIFLHLPISNTWNPIMFIQAQQR